jgi:hypothetical protein
MSVPFQKTVNVTGALREPDQIATGKLALRNPTDAAIEIPAGTAFTDRLGIEYVFTAAISVPATDAAGPGRAEGQIQAKIGGENANREIGLLSGKLDNGVYYSNRDAPVAGGTDKKTPQVSQEDIDQLIADARAEIPRLAVTSTLNDGRIVLPGSIQAGELQYTIDRAVGEQVDTISIQAEMVVTGMAFLPADANAQASEDLQLALASATPASFELESATIAFAPPVLVNDQGDAGLYKLTATASVRASVDQAQRDAAADEIAGMDVDEAETYLRSLPFVADVKIESSPGFLPVRIPGSAGKIEIETT